MDHSPSSRWSWLWPPVATREEAKHATQFAFAAAIVCALGSGILAVLGILGVEFATAANFDADGLADSAVFLLVAWGLWKQSRVAAWVGLLLYLGQRAMIWSTIGMKNPVIAAIIILAFVNGIRGTLAWHRMRAPTSQNKAT